MTTAKCWYSAADPSVIFMLTLAVLVVVSGALIAVGCWWRPGEEKLTVVAVHRCLELEADWWSGANLAVWVVSQTDSIRAPSDHQADTRRIRTSSRRPPM